MGRYDHAIAPWPGPLVWYAFLVGVAAGAYALAAFVSILGNEANRRLVRPAFVMAFGLLAAGLGLLAFESSRDARVWGRLGSWDVANLASFSTVGLVTLIGALAEGGRLYPSRAAKPLARLHGSRFGRALAGAGAVAALGLASSTGPLPSSDWASAGWLGGVSFASALATGSAAVVLLVDWRGAESDDVGRLAAASGGAVVLELALLIGLTLSLRGLSGLAFQRWPGRLIPLLIVPVGLVLPLILRQVRGPRGAVDAAWLILFGGFVLRAAVAGIPESLTLR